MGEDKERLFKILEEGEDFEVLDAIEALSKIGGEDVVEKLVELVEKGKGGIREAAIDALSSMKDKGLVASKAVSLLKSGKVSVRVKAIELLSHLGKDAIGALVPLLKSDDPNVRKYAVDALGGMKIEEAVPLLLEATYDKDPNVKFTAVEYLMEFGSRMDVKKRISELLMEAQDLYGLTAVTFAMRSIGDRCFVKPLKEKLKREKTPFIKHLLYKTLISLGEDVYKEAIENAKKLDAVGDIIKEIILSKGELPPELSEYKDKVPELIKS